MNGPAVSIVIPTLGRPALLAACLDSIAATVRLPHEVICVVVHGDDETRDVVASRNVRSILQRSRGGYVQAVNMGCRAAIGEYVTVLNDDCELLPGAVSNAVRFMEVPAHRRVGQAAFFHDSPVGRNVFAQIEAEGVVYCVCHVRGLCYANFGLTRRYVLRRLEYFDPRYFMYGADPDFSLKIWYQAGLEVVPCPGSLVHHAHVDDERARVEREQQDTDNQELFRKWGMEHELPAPTPPVPQPR